MKVEELITDEKMNKAFENTNFGGAKPRELMQDTLFKNVCGYHSGHTIECIVKELNLVTKKGKLTKKGQNYLYFSFNPIG